MNLLRLRNGIHDQRTLTLTWRTKFLASPKFTVRSYPLRHHKLPPRRVDLTALCILFTNRHHRVDVVVSLFKYVYHT